MRLLSLISDDAALQQYSETAGFRHQSRGMSEEHWATALGTAYSGGDE
jgi:hypothetical protein